MKEWSAKIIWLSNGYRVIYKDSDGMREFVYEQKETAASQEDKEHIVNMFYDIIDFFGEGGSKHDEKRLYVEWKKQTD